MSFYLTEEPDPDPWGDSLLKAECPICHEERYVRPDEAHYLDELMSEAWYQLKDVCDRCWRRAITTQERKAERGAA